MGAALRCAGCDRDGWTNSQLSPLLPLCFGSRVSRNDLRCVFRAIEPIDTLARGLPVAVIPATLRFLTFVAGLPVATDHWLRRHVRRIEGAMRFEEAGKDRATNRRRYSVTCVSGVAANPLRESDNSVVVVRSNAENDGNAVCHSASILKTCGLSCGRGGK